MLLNLSWRKLVMQMLSIIGLFLVLTGACYAATHSITVTDLGYSSDIKIVGPKSVLELEFPIPRGTILPNSQIKLYVKPAPQLNSNGSFDFYVDDSLMSSMTVGQLRTVQGLVILPIATGNTAARSVKVSIRPNIYVTDDICQDYWREQLYYHVQEKSGLILNFTPLPEKVVSDFFHNLYNGLAVIVPDNATLEEANAAAWAYGVLKKTYYYMPVHFIYASERNNYAKLAKLWVGTQKNLPITLNGLKDNIVLAYPNTLVITGDTTENLQTAVEQLVHLPVFDVVGAKNTKTSLVGPQEKILNRDVISFGNNTAQEGVLSIPVDFPIYPALLNAPPKSFAIHLEGVYSSESSSGKPARMNVYFNRNLVHSEVLDASQKLNKDIKVSGTIPILSRNILGVEFVYPYEQGFCYYRGTRQTAQIHYSSYVLGMGSYPVESYAWQNIGMTFNNSGQILLDDVTSGPTVKAAAELVAFINKQLPPGHYALPQFKTLDKINELSNVSYVGIISLASNLPKGITDDFPLGSSSNHTIYNKKSGKVLYEYKPELNTVTGQIGVYKNIPVMLITASNSAQALPEAMRYYNNGNNQDKIQGNVFIYRVGGLAQFIETRDSNVLRETNGESQLFTQKIMVFLQNKLQQANGIWHKHKSMIILISLAVVLVVILRFIIFIRRIREEQNYRGKRSSS